MKFKTSLEVSQKVIATALLYAFLYVNSGLVAGRSQPTQIYINQTQSDLQ
jgi:hypothetical protein